VYEFILNNFEVEADKKWTFSNMMSVIKYHLMTYIDLFKFLKNTEANWDILNNMNQTQLRPV
jgi:hypothetical protein